MPVRSTIDRIRCRRPRRRYGRGINTYPWRSHYSDGADLVENGVAVEYGFHFTREFNEFAVVRIVDMRSRTHFGRESHFKYRLVAKLQGKLRLQRPQAPCHAIAREYPVSNE